VPLSGLIALAHTNRKEFIRFLKFCVVGILGAVVDFGTLNALHLQFGLPVLLANTCSFTLAVISNFTWNRFWTYPESRSKPLAGQLAQFFIVNVAGWAINTGVLWALLGVTTHWFGPLGYNVAKAVATGVVLFWNFFVNRVWTYSDVKLGS
jgi:putative flippase GtrA